MVFGASCSHQTLQKPVISAQVLGAEPALTEAEQQAARTLMAAAHSGVQALQCTLRTTRFGGDGRIRGNMTLLVARPDRFRGTVLAPHGPPLFAMASDGEQLTALDVGAQTYSQHPATAAGIAHYLGGLDLNMDGAAWVNLMLGDLIVPPSALATWPKQGDKKTMTWRWTQGQQRMAATFDGETGVWQRAAIVLGDGREGSVVVKDRDAHGVPQMIALHLGAGGRGRAYEAAQDVEIVLSDVGVISAPLSDDAFQIVAPQVPTL